jgi:hypothetical protein
MRMPWCKSVAWHRGARPSQQVHNGNLTGAVVAPGIMHFMSETPQYEHDPTTSPVATAPPPPSTYEHQPAYVEPVRKPNRLYQVAAWVAIAAGSVLIVAIIFFSGFALGAHSGGGHHGGHHGQGMGMMPRDGQQMMPMRPGFIFPGPGVFGPGGPGMFPGGPGNSGPGQSQTPPAPGGQQRPS